ncbi:hypothetical protein T09_507 [Trichinella sp. T9]|nr:hypothetical protein T09_507 [Trichinella sp. T9]
MVQNTNKRVIKIQKTAVTTKSRSDKIDYLYQSTNGTFVTPFPPCSERNNTDPVGVTRPGGVTRKSRVGKNNTRAPPARSLSEHLAVPSRGQKGFLLRPDLSTFARQLRARHEGGSGQTKGHGSGHHEGIIK